MSMNPLIEHTLGLISEEWPAGAFQSVPLIRVDRNTSRVLDGDMDINLSPATKQNTADLKRSNIVSVAHTGNASSPIGSEYDHSSERTVNLRIEGFSGSYGHVDPDGQWPPTDPDSAVPWYRLWRAVREAVLAGRYFPQTDENRFSYTDIILENEVVDASAYADYSRYEVDVVYRGFETLPEVDS